MKNWELYGYKNKFNKWDFSNITIELFPRKTKPIYPQYVSDEYKKYITWKTANEDISIQNSQGYKGIRFIIFLKLSGTSMGISYTFN